MYSVCRSFFEHFKISLSVKKTVALHPISASFLQGHEQFHFSNNNVGNNIVGKSGSQVAGLATRALMAAAWRDAAFVQ